MADLQIKTNIELEGPWLIGKDQLEALDKAIEDAFARIKSHHEGRVAAAVEQDLQARLKRHRDNVRQKRAGKHLPRTQEGEPQAAQSESDKSPNPRSSLRRRLRAQAEEYVRAQYGYSPPARKIKIEVAGDKKLEGESIGEMIRQPIAESVRPLRFEAELGSTYSAQPSCVLSINPHGDLQIRATPDGSPVALEAFNTLKSWAVSAQAPRWQRWWLKLYGLHWFVFLAVLFMCSVLSSEQPPTSPYIKEAHALLSSGVTPENRDRATEVVLALVSNYIPPGTPQSAPVMSKFTAILVVCVSFALALIAYFSPPKFALGIGLGEKTVSRWLIWLSLLRAIPVFIATAILIPMFRSLLAGWFGLSK